MTGPDLSVWHRAPTRPSVAENELHIWRISLTALHLSCFDSQAFLTAHEQRRAERLLSDLKRQQFVRTRSVLRFVLGCYLGCSPEQIVLSQEGAGKPVLNPDCGLCFNLSHSDVSAVIAVTRDNPVGIDIESVDAKVDIEAVARRFFPAAFQLSLQGCQGLRKRRMFFRQWTNIEAHLKQQGCGLATDLSKFDPVQGQHSQRHFYFAKGVVASVATATPVSKVLRFQL